MNYSYDSSHAKDCFNIQESQNQENLQKFEKHVKNYIKSPETERINYFYRYKTLAYHEHISSRLSSFDFIHLIFPILDVYLGTKKIVNLDM